MSRLLAARTPSTSTSSSQSAGSDPDPGHAGRPKRTLIESACQQCRRRKSRCDGVRPCCTRCQALRTDCIFEAEAGESRWSVLRRRNQNLEVERTEFRELFDHLQSRSESEAQYIFTRMRTGGYDEVLEMLRQLRDTGRILAPQTMSYSVLPPSPPQIPSVPDSTRLPPIQTMFAVANRRPPVSEAPGSTSLAAEFGADRKGSNTAMYPSDSLMATAHI